MAIKALEQSTFQRKPAYAYIRESDKLPTIAEAIEKDITFAKVKIFDPTGSWTWYVVAYDPDTRIAYGLVDGFEKEWGDFSFEELVAIRGRFGLPLERDLHWTPQEVS